MFKKVGIIISSLVVSLASLTTISINNASLQKKSISQTKTRNQHLLYSFNNKIYEDKDEILRDFLLEHPNFIKAKNVLGDVDNAINDYDQNMLNKELLSTYDYKKIGPAYRKPDGQLVKDQKEAKSSYVNPAFLRQRLTDGFNNYFSPENGRQAAINSYARRIFEGTIGVIKIDNFSAIDKQSYNPLSEKDFQSFKQDTSNQIKSNPASVLSNGYSHHWYSKDSGKEIKSIDDLFDGSAYMLKNFIETSFDKYTIMKQMYSPTNGYYDGSNNLRDYSKVHGQNLDAEGENLIGERYDSAKATFSLVTINDLAKTRSAIKKEMQSKEKAKKEFNYNKEKNRFSSANKDNLKIHNKSFNYISKDVVKKGHVDNIYWKGEHEFDDAHTYTFYFGIHVNGEDVSDDTWERYIDDDDCYGWANVELQLKARNIKKTDKVAIKLHAVEAIGVADAQLSMRPVSPIEFKRIVIDSLDDTVYSFDVNSVSLHLFYDGSEEPGVDDMKVEIRHLDEATFDITEHHKIDNSYNEHMSLQLGNIYINQTEWNNNKNNANYLYQKFQEQKPIKYDENFSSPGLDLNYQLIDPTTNNYFKFSNWKIVNGNGNKHYFQIGIKYQNGDNVYSKIKYIKVPIKITEDYDLSIKKLNEKYHNVNLENGYHISSLLDYDENALKYVDGSNVLTKNLNAFDDSSALGSNNNIIKMSYQQFKHFIKIYDKEKNQILARNFNEDNFTNDLYIKVHFDWENTDELYRVPLEKIINNQNHKLASLMNGRQAVNDLQFIIDFSHISLTSDYQKIININFKWAFKDDLSSDKVKQYQQFADPQKEAFEFNMANIQKASLETDVLYQVLSKIQKEVVNNPIWKDNSGFTKFLSTMDFHSYEQKVEERLNLNNHLLWKINRDASQGVQFKSIDFIAERIKKYNFADFLKVLNITEHERNKIIVAIKNHYNDDFKVLIRKAQLKNESQINLQNPIEILAWNYFRTLKHYINSSSLLGSLPNGNQYQFPNLKHIFIGNERVMKMRYLIDSEYIVNGQLLRAGNLDSISELYPNNELGQVKLNEFKKLKISNFEPPLVTQLYNSDGQQFERTNKMNYDSEQITLLNALWSVSPKVLKKYVFYQGKSRPILFQLNLIYYITIPEENITYYFADHVSAKRFIREYIEKFIVTIDLSNQKGGE